MFRVTNKHIEECMRLRNAKRIWEEEDEVIVVLDAGPMTKRLFRERWNMLHDNTQRSITELRNALRRSYGKVIDSDHVTLKGDEWSEYTPQNLMQRALEIARETLGESSSSSGSDWESSQE